jgi:hypothetical protein
MKWFVLQFLLLLCVVDMPVLGKWKERVYSDAEIPDYGRNFGWASKMKSEGWWSSSSGRAPA